MNLKMHVVIDVSTQQIVTIAEDTQSNPLFKDYRLWVNFLSMKIPVYLVTVGFDRASCKVAINKGGRTIYWYINSRSRVKIIVGLGSTSLEKLSNPSEKVLRELGGRLGKFTAINYNQFLNWTIFGTTYFPRIKWKLEPLENFDPLWKTMFSFYPEYTRHGGYCIFWFKLLIEQISDVTG